MNGNDSKPVRQERRLLIIIDSLARGGTQRQMLLLAQGLSARGHRVRVIALNDDTDADNFRAFAAAAELEVMGKVRLAAGLGPLALWRRMLAWRPDAILTVLEVSDILGRAAARLYGRAPVVSSIRARNVHKRAAWLWLDRLTMSWAERVVFNSAAVVPFGGRSEGVRSGQVCVIPNGVEVTQGIAKATDREALGLDMNCRVLLTAGRLHRQKRFDNLLTAMASLPGDLTNTHLLIVGTGPLLAALRRQASDLRLAERVHFLGKREDVPMLLALADAFVLPSQWEGMPNVVMEAMAAGCPVVSTRIDGVTELLPDSAYGWLVEPNRPEELATALTQALRDRAEAEKRAEKARARAIESFSVDAMVDRYEALFEGLLRRDEHRHA